MLGHGPDPTAVGLDAVDFAAVGPAAVGPDAVDIDAVDVMALVVMSAPGSAQSRSALRGQTRVPDHVVLVKVGGDDQRGATLLTDCEPSTDRESSVVDSPVVEPSVVTVSPGCSYGAMVTEALAIAGTVPVEGFLWLLPVDAVPAPDALERLLTYALLDPGAAVIGPHVLDRVDPGVAVDGGASVDSAGRRVTGIRPGDIDDGQHDTVRDVLAVSLTGALVSARAWHLLGGFDPQLRTAFDIDFCWRAWRAGMRVVVFPPATIGRAPAGGGEQVPCLERLDYRTVRRDELRVRLANIGAARFVSAWLWLVPGGLARGVGSAARGRVRRGCDEVAATVDVFGRPGWLRHARRRRAVRARVPARALRPLFPARGIRLRAAWEPLSGLCARPGWAGWRGWAGLRGRATRPGLVLAAALAVVTMCAARFLAGPGWGPGTVGFGIPGVAAPLPLPDGGRDLWSAVLSGWRPGGHGVPGNPGVSTSTVHGTVPSAPWLTVLTLLATVLGGKPWLAADGVLLAGPALAGLAAYIAVGQLRRGLGGPLTGQRASAGLWVGRWAGDHYRARAVIAAGYALGPPMTWAVAVGRVDVVLALIAVPGVLAAAVPLVAGPAPAGRGNNQGSGWSAACGLAVRLLIAVMCAPSLFVSAVVGLAGGALLLRRARRLPFVLVPAAVAAVPLWPWRRVVIDDPGALFTAGTFGMRDPASGWLGGSVPASAQATHLTVALLLPAALAGVIGVVRADTRRPVLAAWGVVLIGLVGATVERHLCGADRHDVAGAQLGVAVAGLLLAATLAASGARAALRRHPFGWRQLMAVSVGGAVVASPVAGGLAFLSGGEVARGAAARDSGVVASAVAVATASGRRAGRMAGVLILRQPSQGSPVAYTLTDTRGPSLADPAGTTGIIPTVPTGHTIDDSTVEAIVGDLTVGGSWGAGELAALAVCAVVVPFPDAPPSLTAVLDAVPGLVREQVLGDAVVWRVVPVVPVRPPAATPHAGSRP
ncbi:glycosyltransferase [Frankia sp. Cr2]|uniref:glycosyltransferase n=1 Tax=Frankia sp. Cr2 TaxID=3073932 RepID=UPI002AD1E110|nr:glycosyltransferase [Frankia sp. Cr2]